MRSLILRAGNLCLLCLCACSSGGSGHKPDAKGGDGGRDARGAEVSRFEVAPATDAKLDARPTADGLENRDTGLSPATPDAPASADDGAVTGVDATPAVDAGGFWDGALAIDARINSDGAAASGDAWVEKGSTDARDAGRLDAKDTGSVQADLGVAHEDGPRQDVVPGTDAPGAQPIDASVNPPIDAAPDAPSPTPDAPSATLDATLDSLVSVPDTGTEPDTLTGQDAGSITSLEGLWEGSYWVDGSSAPAVPMQAIIDPGHSVYLNAMDFQGVGLGTISGTGDVVIDVHGDTLGTVTFVGKMTITGGSGTWSNAGNGHTGTCT